MLVNLHVRGPAGAETLEAGDVARALGSVRSGCPGVPVGIRSGAWIVPDPERRRALAGGWTVLPDFVFVNFEEEGSTDLAELLHRRGVGVEAGLSSVAAALTLPDGGLAAGNGALVAEARRIVADVQSSGVAREG